MATSVILNTSVTNAFRSIQRDLFCKIDINIKTTKKLKIRKSLFLVKL